MNIFYASIYFRFVLKGESYLKVKRSTNHHGGSDTCHKIHICPSKPLLAAVRGSGDCWSFKVVVIIMIFEWGKQNRLTCVSGFLDVEMLTVWIPQLPKQATYAGSPKEATEISSCEGLIAVWCDFSIDSSSPNDCYYIYDIHLRTASIYFS